MFPLFLVIYENAAKLFKSAQTWANSQGGIYSSSETHLRQTKIWNSIHNHNLSEDLSEYPISRQFTNQQLERVAEMTTSSSCSQEIILAIYQNNLSASVINKDIYNTRQ
ncbi:27681_t:CDS:2 [Racocetra persica]|uniref:27681_t:CDS:1 n=1 Tax=Racocetra persica TaxID=160502 RepID=A0ACA9NEZ3_9GLOM|nr:27681_t:CDS:2 [Racocetra persica]